VKKHIFLFICCCPVLLAHAQPSPGGVGLWDANHFLWFTGHWSTSGNKRTFVIDKGTSNPSNPGASNTGGPTPGAPATGTPSTGTPTPGTNPSGTPSDPGTPPGDPNNPDDPPGNPAAGGTVTINPDGKVNLNNGNVDAWNKQMDEELNSAQKYLQDLQAPGNNLDPAAHKLHQQLTPEAQRQVDQIKEYKIDPSEDMLGGSGNSNPPAPGRSLSDAVGDMCRQMRADYDFVINYYNNQVKGHKDDLKYPPPPTVDFDCYSCDSNLRAQYDTATDRYVRNFAKDEIDIVRKGVTILHNLGCVNLSTQTVSYSAAGEGFDDLFRRNKQDPSKAGPCAYLDMWALSDACYGIAKHIYKRAEKMVYDNKANYAAAEAIIRTYNSIERTWCLFSGQKEDESMKTVLSNLLEKAVNHYISELKKNDWQQIGNFALIMDLIRSEELMGGKNTEKGLQFCNDFIKIINGFKMTIDMDVKIGVNDGYKLAHLKGECHIIPSFQDDKNQCYKWVVADENRRDGVDQTGWYLPKELQTIDVKLVATEIVAPGRTPKYTGTKNYTSRLVSLSMDFCHPGNDTIDLSGFTANPPDAGTWLWPNGAVTKEGEIGMEQYFENINDKKKFATDGEAKKAKDELKTQAEQLRVQMEALKAQMTSGQAAGPPGANMEKMMEFKQQALSKVADPVMAKMLFLNFILPITNNDTKLVHAEFDAKKINPQEAKAIVFGYYRIDIINEANGKPQQPGAPASPKK
jgi:hypothetical protein